MKKYVAILVFVLMFFLVSAFAVTAIKASVGKAKAVLNVDLTNGEPAIIERTIKLNNINDYPVSVTVRPDENVEDIVNVSSEPVILEFNESVDLPYTITIDKTGEITVTLLIQFSAVNEEDSQGKAGLAAEILIYSGSSDGSFENNFKNKTDGNLTGDGNNGTSEPKSKLLPVLVIGGILVLIILIIFIIFRMERKK